MDSIEQLMRDLEQEKLKTRLIMAVEQERAKQDDPVLFRRLIKDGLSIKEARSCITELKTTREELFNTPSDVNKIVNNVERLEQYFKIREVSLDFTKKVSIVSNKTVRLLKRLSVIHACTLAPHTRKLALMCDEIVLLCDALSPTKTRRKIIQQSLKNYKYVSECWLADWPSC
jgi:hypothetical protein